MSSRIVVSTFLLVVVVLAIALGIVYKLGYFDSKSFVLDNGKVRNGKNAVKNNTISEVNDKSKENGVNLISPSDFKNKIDEGGYILVDIRTPKEYQEGHIRGAINIDFYQPDFKDQVAKLDKKKKYLYYCRSGHRSREAEVLAKELGFKDVYELQGGINAWKEAGYPLVTAKKNTKSILLMGDKKTSKDNRWYRPQAGIKWQWQLNGPINTSYDVDLYDLDLTEVPQEVIEQLHHRGIKVICYFSAGTWEEWRPDAKKFQKSVIGKSLDDWDDEKWLNVAQFIKFAPIISKRMDLAVKKGCDGIEPDNIDGYSNDTGFKITVQDQLRYNKWLAREAHKRGLAIALKNDIEQVGQLVNDFDFAINEQCFEYNECAPLREFIKQNKAVLGVEYELKKEEFCPQANAMKFSWLKMDYDLKGGRDSCR